MNKIHVIAGPDARSNEYTAYQIIGEGANVNVTRVADPSFAWLDSNFVRKAKIDVFYFNITDPEMYKNILFLFKNRDIQKLVIIDVSNSSPLSLIDDVIIHNVEPIKFPEPEVKPGDSSHFELGWQPTLENTTLEGYSPEPTTSADSEPTDQSTEQPPPQE